MRPSPRPSLRSRLSRQVLLPLALTWLAGSLVAVEVAQYFTGRAFDRSLLDDAYMVASNVRTDAGELRLDMSPRELQGVLFDQAESMLLKVQTPDGRLVAGQAALQPADAEGDLPYRFRDVQWQGRVLRTVTLHRAQPTPFVVIMGQTNHSRSLMLRNVLLYATVPQLVLLVGLAWWLRRAIGRETEPLSQLQQTVDRRSEADLTPIEVPARTRDVEQLGAAINSLLARLSMSLAAQREFTGNVAHELRTPLAGIRALAEYGLAHTEPQIWRTQLERIAGSEARASRLVDQLLALALADEVRTGLALQPVALDELASEAVMRFLPRADAAGVDLGARDVDEPARVQAHPMLVEGILNNLIDNALRYAKAAEGPSAITVQIVRGETETELRVVDNGPGLPPGAEAELRDRWVRGPLERVLGTGPGVGLGLSIVSQYAQLLGTPLIFGTGDDGRGLAVGVRFSHAPEPPLR